MTELNILEKDYCRLKASDINTDGMIFLLSTLVRDALAEYNYALAHLVYCRKRNVPDPALFNAERRYRFAAQFFYTKLFQSLSGYSGEEYIQMKEEELLRAQNELTQTRQGG